MREFFKEMSPKIIAIMATASLLCSCEAEFEENDDQRKSIVSFLESSHTPALIPQNEINSSLEEFPSFYVEYDSYAYLYVTNYYDIDRTNKPQIAKGSKVSITYRLYPFSGSTISDKILPTYTNDPTYKQLYVDNGLNIEYWNFEPTEITIGRGDMIKGIEQGIIGCHEGDIIEIYMTRNMGYGSDVIGVMEKDSAVAFFCVINSVK